MRTIIAGSRGITNLLWVPVAVVRSGFTITEVVSGKARGADSLGEQWAKIQGIPVKEFPAYWEDQGRAAGYIRNARMALYAEALIALWDGKSPGTRSMISLAREAGLQVYVQLVS